MAITIHGHHIAGTPEWDDKRPLRVARCGGPGICNLCSREAAMYMNRTMTPKGFDTMAQLTPNPILRYFEFEHLPLELQEVSRQFHATAIWMEEALPPGPEKSVALRKLLEAKDAAVRSAL